MQDVDTSSILYLRLWTARFKHEKDKECSVSRILTAVLSTYWEKGFS